MNKDNILYGVIGLLAGLIIGYLATNSINRNAMLSANTAVPKNAGGETGALPAGHPAVDSASGGSQPDVMAAIEKARKEPSNFDAQMQAATLFARIQRYKESLEFYEHAYQLQPKNFDVLAGLGNANFDLEKYPDAERWYKQALELKPESVNVRTDLGLTYYLREPRDLDKAIETYRASLRYDPRHEMTLQNLTAALIDKGDKTGARETLKQLEQVSPSNKALPELRAKLGTP